MPEAESCSPVVAAASPPGAVKITLLLLWMLVAAALVHGLHPWDRDPALQPLPGTVDPNTAPWWELTALPHIGETIAREIVAYREKQAAVSGLSRVFREPADLEPVRGIGPKTIEAVAPYLRFDP